jgi:hypothetical protein
MSSSARAGAARCVVLMAYNRGMRHPARLLALGAVVAVAGGCASSHGRVEPGVPTTQLADVTFSVPAGFTVRRGTSCLVGNAPDSHCPHYVLVTSFPQSDHLRLRGLHAFFRRTGVSLLLVRPARGRTFRLGDGSLPLWRFQMIAFGGPTPEAGHVWETDFRAKSATYEAQATLGPRSTRAERAALARLIGSVHAVGVTPRPVPRHPGWGQLSLP